MVSEIGGGRMPRERGYCLGGERSLSTSTS